MTDYDATSERVSESAYQSNAGDFLIYLFHIATYEFARPYVEGKHVLDFGCGTGYGAHRLASAADQITGVDVAPGAIKYATDRYMPDAAKTGAKLEYRVINPVEESPLPFPKDHFDTVLSFQVIEHVPVVRNYLAEIRRVLRPGGVFLCATPDRRTRLFRGQRPFNRFHIDEWSPQDLVDLLRSVFDKTAIYGMTAPAHVIGLELKRCRTTRLLTYPFTFPGAPEPWRQSGLTWMKKLRPDAVEQPGASDTAGDSRTPESQFGFGLHDIRIEPGAWPSTNTVAVSS